MLAVAGATVWAMQDETSRVLHDEVVRARRTVSWSTAVPRVALMSSDAPAVQGAVASGRQHDGVAAAEELGTHRLTIRGPVEETARGRPTRRSGRTRSR